MNRQNDDFRAVSVTERCCLAAVMRVDRLISERFALLVPVVVVMSTGVLTRSENFSFRHDKLSGMA